MGWATLEQTTNSAMKTQQANFQFQFLSNGLMHRLSQDSGLK
jgi:hypothetical protein